MYMWNIFFIYLTCKLWKKNPEIVVHLWVEHEKNEIYEIYEIQIFCFFRTRSLTLVCISVRCNKEGNTFSTKFAICCKGCLVKIKTIWMLKLIFPSLLLPYKEQQGGEYFYGKTFCEGVYVDVHKASLYRWCNIFVC